MSKPAADGGNAYERWELPAVTSRAGRGAAPTVEQIEEIQRQAYAEGFERGHQDSITAAGQKLQQFEKLMAALHEPFVDLDHQVEQEIALLATAIARRLVRRELKTDPGQIVAVVREAISVLPAAARNVRVQLHPDDAALVRELLSLDETEGSWRVVEDPILGRGDCKVMTETSKVDATVESRLNALFAAMLGGNREEDSGRDT